MCKLRKWHMLFGFKRTVWFVLDVFFVCFGDVVLVVFYGSNVVFGVTELEDFLCCYCCSVWWIEILYCYVFGIYVCVVRCLVYEYVFVAV